MKAAPESTLRETFDPPSREKELLEHAGRLVERSIAGGADEAEAIATRSESIAVSFEKGDLKLTTVDSQSSYGVRAFLGKRLGFASTNQSDEASLATCGADALTLARMSPPDDANALPAALPLDERPSLVDPSLAEVPIEEAVRLARELVDRTLATDPRLSVDRASLEVGRSSVAIRSSAGVRAAESDALISLSLFGMAVDGEDVGGFDIWAGCVRELSRVEACIDEVVQRFTRTALGNLGATRGESYRGPVLFSPSAFLDVFIAPLVAAASSIAVQRGRSALAGKLGEIVADPALEIRDDPSDVVLAGAGRFDREGVPARPYDLVREGRLAGYLYNAYSARVEGRESSGHATGGARSVPGLGPHALDVAAGSDGSAGEMLSKLGKGLYVQRFSGTVDSASGDFSGVAKAARWVEGGEVVRSVREVLMSGNAFELVRSLAALSGSRVIVMGSARVPWALVDGVTVTAG